MIIDIFKGESHYCSLAKLILKAFGAAMTKKWICFTSLNIDKSVYWEVDEENNRALCLYRGGDKKTIDALELNHQLKSIPGIKIIDAVAIIEDLNAFKQQHDSYDVPEKLSLVRNSRASLQKQFQA